MLQSRLCRSSARWSWQSYSSKHTACLLSMHHIWKIDVNADSLVSAAKIWSPRPKDKKAESFEDFQWKFHCQVLIHNSDIFSWLLSSLWLPTCISSGWLPFWGFASQRPLVGSHRCQSSCPPEPSKYKSSFNLFPTPVNNQAHQKSRPFFYFHDHLQHSRDHQPPLYVAILIILTLPALNSGCFSISSMITWWNYVFGVQNSFIIGEA